jgi:hypothetical protein
MKTLIIVLTLLLIAPITDAQDLGFGTMNWGDPPKPGMILQDSRGRYKFCSDPLDKENRELVAYGIEDLTYGFCKNQFCELLGRVKGRENFNRMFFGLHTERGTPSVNKHVTIWFAQTDVLIFFEEETDTGYFLFYNNPIHFAMFKESRAHIKHEKETRYLPKKEHKHDVNKKKLTSNRR